MLTNSEQWTKEQEKLSCPQLKNILLFYFLHHKTTLLDLNERAHMFDKVYALVECRDSIRYLVTQVLHLYLLRLVLNFKFATSTKIDKFTETSSIIQNCLIINNGKLDFCNFQFIN